MRDLTLVSYKMIREREREREREKERDRDRERKQPSPAKKSRRVCTFFISHLSMQNRNDNVA